MARGIGIGISRILFRRLHAAAAAPRTATKKENLVDAFGRKHDYLRISLTERCNLRCTYCMPESGVQLQPKDQILSDDEIVHLATIFARQGVKKIRLTGGEPLIRPNIVDLVGRIRSIEGIDRLGITTNALRLERKLPDLLNAGVTQLNISLDTLIEPKFSFITRRKGFSRVLSAIRAAEKEFQDASLLKVNCVIMRGTNEEELIDFVELTRSLRLTVRFIEYMPFDSNKWNDNKFVPFTEMLADIRKTYPHLERDVDQPCATQKTYRIDDDAPGRVGFITSMSDHFCGSCNRLRITADGHLKVCLFGEEEISLRDLIREGCSEADIAETVRTALGQKKAALGGHENMHNIAEGSNRPMILIGG